MAKKKKSSSKIDSELDFDDLDDLGEGMDFGADLEEGPAREPSRSQVTKELAKDAGKGFFDSLIKQTTKDALPDQYTSSYSDVMDLYGFAGDVVDRNKEKLNKTMFKFGKEVKRVLPFKLSMLDKYLEAQQANFESFKQQTEEEIRNAGIQSELSSIFDKQLSVQKAMEARRDAQNDVDKKEQLMQAKLSNDIFVNIDSNIAQQTAFTVEVSKQFYRKSLEIQFKSYFVQADMLRTMRDHYKAFSIQFGNIEKNTSLPEFVKLKNTERLQDILRTQATQSVYNQLFERSKFMDGMKKRLAGFVDSKVDSVTSTVDNFTDMLGNITGGAEASGSSPVMLMGSIASSMLGGTLGEKLSAKISPKIKDKIKDNKTVNTGANYLSMLANSPASLVQLFRQKAARKEAEYEDESSPGRWLSSKAAKGMGSLLDIASPMQVDASVSQLGYLDHNKPAIFDQKVHRSISEAIPMYLARILKQNTDLTSMYHQANQDKVKHPNSDLLVYDFQNRELKSGGAIRSSIEKTVFGNKSTEQRSKSIGSSILSQARQSLKASGLGAIEQKQAQKTLSGNRSEKLLTSYIEQAKKQSGVNLSYNDLVNNYEKNADLSAIVEKSPELKELLDTLKASKAKMPYQVDSRMKDLRNTYPLEGVKKLFSEASKLARAVSPHVVTDEVATVFSKAFSTYILMTGRDVDAESVITRRAFSFMKDEAVTGKVENSLIVLMDDVKRVRNTDDMFIQSSLDSLFALMNFTLKENINIDPSVYQTLSELYPSMVKKGQLSIENIAEGKLEGQDDQEYVSFDRLKEMSKNSKVDVIEKRKEITYDNLVDRANKIASEGLKAAAEALKETHGNPVAVAELLLKTARNYKSSVSTKIKANYNSTVSSFGAAVVALGDYGVGLLEKGIPVAIAQISKTLASLDERINLLQVDLNERRAEMNRIGSEISDVVNGSISQNRLQNLDRAYTAYVEAEIKTLMKVRTALQRHQNELIQIRNGGHKTAMSTLKMVRESFADTLLALRQSLVDLEKRGRELDMSKF